MTRIEKSVEIRAPPEKVWEMLAFDKALEWMDEWKSVKYTSEVHTPEDKYRVGTSVHVTEKHVEFDLEITGILENQKITARSKGRSKREIIRIDKKRDDVLCQLAMPASSAASGTVSFQK